MTLVADGRGLHRHCLISNPGPGNSHRSTWHLLDLFRHNLDGPNLNQRASVRNRVLITNLLRCRGLAAQRLGGRELMINQRDWRVPEGCLGCPVRRDGFCGKLTDRVQARLASLSRLRDYAAGHIFWDEVEEPRFVGIVRKGHLRMQRHSLDGRRQIVEMIAPGRMIGSSVETRIGYGVEASTNASLCRLERGAFQRLMGEEPELRKAVLSDYVERLEAIRQQTWAVGLQSAEERLCGFLIKACSVMPYQPQPDGSGVLSLEIPRADLADLLGTTKETISRTMHHLQRLGLIEIRDPRHLRLSNVERLAEIGGVGSKSMSQNAPKPRPTLVEVNRKYQPGTREPAGLVHPAPGVHILMPR